MAGKILIVDDVATNRVVLRVKLSGARYVTIQAASGAEALRLARAERPDLILLDLQLPDRNGIDICRELKSDPLTYSIPIIVVTAFATPEARIAALKAGAEDFMPKPLDELVLLARLRSLMRMRESDEELRLRESTCRELGFAEHGTQFVRPARVALIAPSRDVSAAWKRALTPCLRNSELVVMNRDEALSEATGHTAPDAFVIAADLGRPGEGLRLMSELRSRAATRHAAVCIGVNATMRETAAVALDLGASDLVPSDLTAPRAAEETALRIEVQLKRKRIADQLRDSVADGLRLAVTDPLTGLYNRRYALPHLARIAKRAGETGRPYAVMVLDLDHFKSVNDTYGHAAGDAVLVDVARRIARNMRETDLVARIGGEEFLIVMPETVLEDAHRVAERLCTTLDARPVEIAGTDQQIPVTVSIGLAMGGGETGAPDFETALVRADMALLEAKAGGRNHVTISASAA
ncbi:diguanylate cyclase [Phaeovulum vinaykumarii]|uniref:diguanylate cyclase n=1 Tax=Phaeovulum vinaykumarii TaxID=407234 RepID=A0A1N7KWA3_9RHOB|nr:diguanylate cyclase [Phaeovulum vinaykumarii]SIS65817.1 response regulator receiver modulated diguanylate cyclase [Phaeovulum vinaykumarii]SOC01176.1 response regulator receiver modulated diguanylate cyclase [Phaeovulum vinaykumarii]